MKEKGAECVVCNALQIGGAEFVEAQRWTELEIIPWQTLTCVEDRNTCDGGQLQRERGKRLRRCGCCS